MGFGKKFIRYVHCLLGNARPFVFLNGMLTPSIYLKRSIRQGCPWAPLMFVIVVDALGWLVDSDLNKGDINGLQISCAPNQLCLLKFVDNTNSFVHNDPHSIESF